MFRWNKPNRPSTHTVRAESFDFGVNAYAQDRLHEVESKHEQHLRCRSPFDCGVVRLLKATGFVLAFAALTGFPSAATAAQPAYPTKPIRMIVAVPPGGPADTLARLVAPKLTESLGQAVVIDNRAGANGIIAYETTARATPDGYTFTAVASGVVINPRIQKARSIAVWILAYAGMTYKPISSVRRDDVQTM